MIFFSFTHYFTFKILQEMFVLKRITRKLKKVIISFLRVGIKATANDE